MFILHNEHIFISLKANQQSGVQQSGVETQKMSANLRGDAVKPRVDPLFVLEDHGYPIAVHTELGDFVPVSLSSPFEL